VLGYVRAPEIAEEIVQEIFANVWERRAEWVVKDSVRSYLYGSARNRALSHLKHTRVAAQWEAIALRDLEVARDVGGAGADERVRTQDFARALVRAIERLPMRRRQAYTLRWQHQLPLSEIARVMGVTVKCVELHLAAASKVLRAELTEFFD
jgi:RNA polymerase sigma-70 factor (ECF subfamily)